MNEVALSAAIHICFMCRNGVKLVFCLTDWTEVCQN